MLDAVRNGFREARLRFRGQQTLSEEVIKDAVKQIRISLLEADVAPEVAKEFLDRVSERAIGEVVKIEAGKGKKRRKVRPEDHFVSICNEELTRLLGEGVPSEPLRLPRGRVNTILVMGLQGSGKTTSVGKLANWLLKQKRKPLMVAADIYRPAAVDQLRTLGERLDVPVFHEAGLDPVELCKRGVEEAKRLGRDVVLFDTAGRLAIDDTLMGELEQIDRTARPDYKLFVCDAMIGQDAVRTARTFHQRLPFDGVILTKLDGDARGGAALSIRKVTGAPVLFAGMGEDLERLEVFRAEGMASRILGMGDIVGLMEEFSEVVDEEQAEEDARRMLRGQITFTDFLEQLRTLQRMGPLKNVLDKVPMFSDAMAQGLSIDDGQLRQVECVIQSMTRSERMNPALLSGSSADSRIARIAKGSGRSRREIRDLIQRFGMVRDMMGNIGSSGGLMEKMGFGQMAAMRKLQQRGLGGVSMADLQAGAGLLGKRGSSSQRKTRNVGKLKNKRKNARKQRKKNRKR